MKTWISKCFFPNKHRRSFPQLPFSAANRKLSVISTKHDGPGQPTSSIIEKSLQAIFFAFHQVSLEDLNQRLSSPPYYPNIFPGEHYRLLAGFVSLLQPRVIIEIGTATGLSALALKKHLPQEGKIYTFDLVSWKDDPNTHLTQEDFQDGRLVQYIADLSSETTFIQYRNLLQEASLIFIDVTHDGLLEEKLWRFLTTLPYNHPCYVIFDDILLWDMLAFWRNIAHPKLDLTSFGHWSGTGVVELIP